MTKKIYKDMEKMVFKLAILGSAVAVFAAQDSIVQKQQTLLDKLTTIQENAFGFGLEGVAKSGYTGVNISSDQLADNTPTSETQAFSQMNLVVSARPSAETKARVEVRMHQDWQKAHEQGVNPLLVHWWSYDGRTLNRKVKFNLGHMRVGYTPLTIWQPQVALLQEPLIFKERRLESMSYQNLLDTTARLMQGANAEYHSGSVSVLDDVRAQMSLARLRNNTKKSDQVFFDFDREDRYLLAGNAGVGAYGASIGVNYVSTFDRMKSTKTVEIIPLDTVRDEVNNVLSFLLGFNTSKLLDSKSFGGGFNVEYASSTLKLNQITSIENRDPQIQVIPDERINPDGYIDTTLYLTVRNSKIYYQEEIVELMNLKGSALLLGVNAFADIAGIEADLNVHYLDNSEEFASEMASTPSFLGGTPIFNSDAQFNAVNLQNLEYIRSGSLENMYFSVYQSQTLTQKNLIGKGGTVNSPPATSEDYRLYNNFKMAHFYRNGYNNQTFQVSELGSKIDYLDPSLDLALPLGYATPDRSGFDLALDLSWNDAVTLNGRFASHKMKSMDQISYTKIGVGIGCEIDEIVGYSKTLDLQLSYEGSTETKGMERKSSRIMAGTNTGLWRGLSLLLGYQALSMEYGFSDVKKSTESLMLVGPQVEITTGAKFSAQYGLMSNKVEYTDIADGMEKELAINKSLIMANLSVQF